MRFSTAYMNTAVAPGTDFYEHACGTWLKSNHIPPDHSNWGPTAVLMDANLERLRAICEECQGADASKGGPERMRALVGHYYEAVLDLEARDKQGFAPIEPELKKVADLTTKAELAAVTGSLHQERIGPFFEWWVDADERDSDHYALHLWQSGLSLPDRDYYLNEDFASERKAFVDHLGRMFALAGDSPAEASDHAATILRIETALARVSKPSEDLNDSEANYHKMTPAELEALMPGWKWSDYFNGLGLKAPPAFVIIGQPDFFTAAAKVIAAEPLDALQTYLRWHAITTAAPSLHHAADAEDFSFFGKVLRGVKEQMPMWKRAIGGADHMVGDALGQLYAEHYFPPEARARMEEMVANLKSVYRERIRHAGWMGDTTRAKALEKLERFTAKLGYPKKWKDYAGLEIRKDDAFGNRRRATIWESLREIHRIGGPVDRDEWGMTAPTVNAYYNASNNEIVFPAGILQPPFFDLEMDDAVNYGATGATIGHEMTHGFDSDGRKYDADGNLKDWWTEADAREYERRAHVLVEQFNHLDGLPGVKVNGKLTLPENIADLGGIVLAYEALQRALAADPAKRRAIDGLTPEQRFFISYAQSWISLNRPESVRQLLTSDSHAPDPLRAVAPLQNFQPWYDAFHIQPGDKLWLDPKQRAEIW